MNSEEFFKKLEIPINTELDKQVINVDFEKTLDLDFIKNLDSASDRSATNLPGAYGAVFGNVEYLKHPVIQRKWKNIKSVLKKDFFIASSSNTLNSIEKIINSPSQTGVRSTIYCTNKSGEYATSSLKVYDIEEGVFIEETAVGIIYTHAMLKRGVPVVFGVNCLPYPCSDGNEEDVSTNHYVLVVGMGNDGNNYFYAWDIASTYPFQYLENGIFYNGGVFSENKIYLDKNWPGLLRADNTWGSSYSQSRQPYKVTRIFRSYPLKRSI